MVCIVDSKYIAMKLGSVHTSSILRIVSVDSDELVACLLAETLWERNS